MSLGRTHILAQCRSIQHSRHPDKMPKCSIGQFFLPTVSVSSTEIPAQCRSHFCSYSCLPLALCADRALTKRASRVHLFCFGLGFRRMFPVSLFPSEIDMSISATSITGSLATDAPKPDTCIVSLYSVLFVCEQNGPCVQGGMCRYKGATISRWHSAILKNKNAVVGQKLRKGTFR